MLKARAALLGTALAAIPLTFALAASPARAPAPGMVVYDAAGHPIGVLAPLPATAPPAGTFVGWGDDGDMFLDPMRLFAQQEAMMRRISQDMAAAMPALDAATERTIQAAFRHDGPLPDGASQVVVTSFSSGDGTCRQTVTYSYPGNGTQPKVAVQKIGDACGALTLEPPHDVPAAAPQAVPDGSRLIQVKYPHAAAAPIRG